MLTRTGFFNFLSFEDKLEQIDNELLEKFVSAKLYSLVRHPSQTFLFPVMETAIIQDSFNCSYSAHMLGFSIDNKSI